MNMEYVLFDVVIAALLILAVVESREKNFIYYELNTSVLEEIMLWISELKGGTSDVEKI